MTRKELYEHPGWQWCSAQGAELHTLLIGLQTTFREKLDWLEEAENLTLRPVAPWLRRFALRALPAGSQPRAKAGPLPSFPAVG